MYREAFATRLSEILDLKQGRIQALTALANEIRQAPKANVGQVAAWERDGARSLKILLLERMAERELPDALSMSEFSSALDSGPAGLAQLEAELRQRIDGRAQTRTSIHEAKLKLKCFELRKQCLEELTVIFTSERAK